jgi:hypothetical protein
MHGLQTIIKNNQEDVDRHLAEADKANANKVFETNVAQDKALEELKRNS